MLAHYDKEAKSLERYAERARIWSDGPQRNPFEQTVYVHSRLNTRQLVADDFKPTGTFNADVPTKRSRSGDDPDPK